MTEDEEEQGQSRAISEPDCIELLQAHDVGRLAWQTADGPQILPISYVYHEGRVVFRTSPYGPMAELIQSAEVALEIDELDLQRRAGWSVVVQGRAEAVDEPTELVRLWAVDGAVPWAAGVRNLFIQITPRQITGRTLKARP
jgi:nitroimidazol reductase NimA-like FMN-containing flavoprotein (pyridoxamine 5'-phosphate oxidase superfamily)